MAGAWDSVVTCFFIDTAHNIVEYLEVIARALKPGGVRNRIIRGISNCSFISLACCDCGIVDMHFVPALVV